MTQPLNWVARARGVYLSLAGLSLHLHCLAGLALHLAGLSVHPSCVFSFFSPPLRASGQSVVAVATLHHQDSNQEVCHVPSLDAVQK